MNEQIQAKLEEIKAPALAQAAAVDALPALIDADREAYGQERYKAGQDSMILPSPTLPDGSEDPALKYTQADADRLAAQVRLENDEEVALKDAEIEQLKADKAAMQVEIDSLPTKVAEAKEAYKVEVTAKIQAFEANEDQSMRDLVASL